MSLSIVRHIAPKGTSPSMPLNALTESQCAAYDLGTNSPINRSTMLRSVENVTGLLTEIKEIIDPATEALVTMFLVESVSIVVTLLLHVT